MFAQIELKQTPFGGLFIFSFDNSVIHDYPGDPIIINSL